MNLHESGNLLSWFAAGLGKDWENRCLGVLFRRKRKSRPKHIDNSSYQAPSTWISCPYSGDLFDTLCSKPRPFWMDLLLRLPQCPPPPYFGCILMYYPPPREVWAWLHGFYTMREGQEIYPGSAQSHHSNLIPGHMSESHNSCISHISGYPPWLHEPGS